MSLVGIYLGRASYTPDYCVVYDDCYELVSAVCFGSLYLLSTDHTLVSCFWNKLGTYQSPLQTDLFTCQLSRVRCETRVESFDLTPAHACGPISHAWLKNVSCCRLAWHNFQKYVNSDPCKERKPCVKWLTDNNSSRSLIFEVKSTGSELTFIRVLRLGLDNFAFGRLRTSSEVFGLLRESSEMIVSSSKIRG